MSEGYRDAIAEHGATLVTHIGLVDASGTELDGGSPAYGRHTESWDTASGGIIRLAADLTFNVPDSTTVGGWRGFSALSAGTNYGGHDLDLETYSNQGTYKLLAASTGIRHIDPV